MADAGSDVERLKAAAASTDTVRPVARTAIETVDGRNGTHRDQLDYEL